MDETDPLNHSNFSLMILLDYHHEYPLVPGTIMCLMKL